MSSLYFMRASGVPHFYSSLSPTQRLKNLLTINYQFPPSLASWRPWFDSLQIGLRSGAEICEPMHLWYFARGQLSVWSTPSNCLSRWSFDLGAICDCWRFPRCPRCCACIRLQRRRRNVLEIDPPHHLGSSGWSLVFEADTIFALLPWPNSGLWCGFLTSPACY
jgi:hypothetical protein